MKGQWTSYSTDIPLSTPDDPLPDEDVASEVVMDDDEEDGVDSSEAAVKGALRCRVPALALVVRTPTPLCVHDASF
jgi:hypothetical protein